MPVKTNYFSPFNKRFDFGVPLEDIFPPNDIHPRLKYLFEQAYTLYIRNRFPIDEVVRQLQGSLETRLKLKQKILHDVHYDIKLQNIEEAPGAYFWLIRHFLGLLPVPLLPTYSQDIRFDWISLSKKCKIFLQQYESLRDQKDQLDYEFAENLNLLPFEHFLLLTILVHFIRKISKKALYGRQINRRTLFFLCKYYCASICVRPYTPGHKDGKMFPLFFYLLLRWHAVEKHCRRIGHPAYFIEGNLTYKTHANLGIRDNWAQTTNFSPTIIPVYKTVPYFCNNNNYLRDTGSQTDHLATIDKYIQDPVPTCEKKTTEKVSDQESISVYPSLVDTNSVPIDNVKRLKEATSTPITKKYFSQDEKLYDNTELSLISTERTNKAEWSDVMRETASTVKKVEEYIYDDYETFNKEEYNQISETRSSFIHKLPKIGWTYTPNNSAREKDRNRSDKNELDETYVRFEDVFDENGKYKTNGNCDDNDVLKVKDEGLNIAFKRCDNSKTPLFNKSSVKSADKAQESESKSKKNFNLKRFKLKLDFLRVLTPKKNTCSTPSYDSIASKVKYKKIKSGKSNTL